MQYGKIGRIFYFMQYGIKTRLSSGRPKPLLAGFKLTHKCNLQCDHCPFWKKEGPHITYAEAEDVLLRLHKEGVRILIFEGGEPLLWTGIEQLTAKAKQLFFTVGITTNGTLDLCRADPDLYFISIDGPQKIHDQIRGKSFDRIMGHIGKHKKHNIIANITISSRNQDHILDLVQFLEGRIKGSTIQFFYPFPGVEELSVAPQKREALLDSLIGLKKKGYHLLDSYHCLERMKDNSWKCYDFLIASADPDGYIYHGCYLKNRIKDIYCAKCGYAAHCEISAAYRFVPGAIATAAKIFW